MSPEYVITMYDTKSRELRWNATFSDYSAPLCEESYHYSEWLPLTGATGASSPSTPLAAGPSLGAPWVMLPWPAGLGRAHCWGKRPLCWSQLL